MQESHLSLETLAKLLTDRIEHEELVEVVLPHLLALCPVCKERREELGRLLEEAGHWDEAIAVYEWGEAPRLLENLAAQSYEEQLRLVEENEELHSWGLCQLLLKRSFEAGFSDPDAAVRLAHLAIKVALNLGDRYDPNWVLDLQAKAFAYLGNAMRVLGELRGADEAFLESERRLSRSTTGSMQIEAEILHLKSSLRRSQRRGAEARELIERSLAMYRKIGDSYHIGVVLLKKAKALEEAGGLDEAIEGLRAAKVEFDAANDGKLSDYARFNLLACLTRAERFTEAEQLLAEVRQARDVFQPLDLIRLRWTAGVIDAGLGRSAPAETALREVQLEFLERNMGYDAALVSLDLAALYAKEGRSQDLKRLAAELVPIFGVRDVHREALVALFMLQQACEQDRLTVELARHLADFLRKERQPRPTRS